MKHLSTPWRGWLLVALCWLAGHAAPAQTPDWQQALAISTPAGSSSEVSATALAPDGSVYVAGSFNGTVSFGSTILSSPTTYAAFVAKWNPGTGTWAWALAMPTGLTAYVSAVAVNGSSVYLTGNFVSSATFGSTTLTSAGSYRGFVAKLTDAGPTAGFVWAQGIGGATYDFAFGLAVQGTSLYVVGDLNSPRVSFGTTILTNSGYSTGYVTKLVDAGSSASYAWAQAVISPTLSQLRAVVVQGSNVYVAGHFAGPAACGSTSLATSNANDFDVVVAKLTDAGTTGSFTWARQAGGTGTDRSTALAVAGTSVYLAGSEDSPTATFGNTSLTGLGNTDAFVAKLTDAGATGSFVWAQSAGGTGFDGVTALAVQGPSVYCTGYTTSPQVHFGSTTLPGLGDYDAFVARLLDAGSSSSFAWVRPAGGAGSDEATTLLLRGTQVVVGGYTEGSARFSTQVITSLTANTFGFLASLTDATLAATAPTVPLEEVSLYPNPTHASATVVVPAMSGVVTLTVLDTLGRPLCTQAAATNASTRLDLSGLAPGLYTLRVVAGAGTATRRLVVE
ncbi:T9SS type A sorting domain-containing protein [Hymenobacter terricola]|uniref:T9SS type A sorting domain-containing protein n=1 Tax=Hymenobacter terricola TaxID=2819236 RepID=UPI001B3063B2|nr:T9SS type A sorting domain-containing protein [Hymenobacter terricola]